MNKLRIIKIILGLLTTTVFLFAFQNCDQGFSNATDADLSALESNFDENLEENDSDSGTSELVAGQGNDFVTSSATRSREILTPPSINRLSQEGNGVLRIRIYKGRLDSGRRNSNGRRLSGRRLKRFNVHINGNYWRTVTCSNTGRRYCNTRPTFRASRGWEVGDVIRVKVAGLDDDGNYSPISATRSITLTSVAD